MHVHISGLDGLKTALYVLVIIGTLNLVAQKHMSTSKFWASYARLYGFQGL